jgi:hypothetical protein
VRDDGNGGLFQFAGARGPGIDHDATLLQSAPFGDPENLAVKTEKPRQLRRLIFGSHPNGEEKRYRQNRRWTRGGHNHFGAQLNSGFTRYDPEAKNLRANVGLCAGGNRAGAGFRQNIEKLLTVKPLLTGREVHSRSTLVGLVTGTVCSGRKNREVSLVVPHEVDGSNSGAK